MPWCRNIKPDTMHGNKRKYWIIHDTHSIRVGDQIEKYW